MTDLAIQEIARAIARQQGFSDPTPYLSQAQAAYAVARKHFEAEVVVWLREQGRDGWLNREARSILVDAANAIERGDYRQEEQS